VIRLLLLELAAAVAFAAHGAWALDRRLNGGPPAAREHRLTRALLALGRRVGVLVPPPPPPLVVPARLVERAGRPGGLADRDLASLRTGALTAFAALGAGVWVAAPGPRMVSLALGAAGFGWLYPELWLRSLAARRTEAIERQAPLALDLLAATVAAGVPLDVAIAGAGTAVSGPLREELEATREQVALGRPRGDALRDLAERSGAPTLAALATAARTSDELGVPLAATLRRHAARARAARAREVQRQAAVAGPKILAVVVLVLVPASLLPLAAAVALSVVDTLGSLDVGG
jgi:tight adherence protein C